MVFAGFAHEPENGSAPLSLVLTFEKSSGERVSRGPFTVIRLEGEIVREGETGALVAHHLPHGWSVDGEAFLRMDVREDVKVKWEGSPPDGLPSTTGHFSSVDGVAFIDRRILGFVDRERNDWYLMRQGQHFPVLSLEPA